MKEDVMRQAGTAAIVAIIVVAIAAAAYLAYSTSNYRNAGSTTLPASTSIQGGQRYTQQFCLNAAANATAMRIAVDNGTRCFRTDISLNQGEMNMVSNVTKAGGQYLGILDYDTVGAQPSRYGCISGCSWTLNTWNQSVANALASYPEISTWEIWNEPLIQEFASGYENGSALNYYNMIKSAYLIIKSKEPNSTIVCFGGAQVYPMSTAESEYQFYRQVWGYGAGKYCDAISLHAYTEQYYNFSQDVSPGITLLQEYNYTLNLYENLTSKPVWITETGLPSNNYTAGVSFSAQRQAEFLSQDLGFFSSFPFVKRVYWFHLDGATAKSADYGLLNSTTLQPKPAWYAFLKFVGNSTQG